jgi:conjugal transfer/entry exclusion protein
MTTLKIIPGFSSAETLDFVSTDEAALASHMKSCESARGRFFGLESALQSTHSLLTPRIVTVGALLTFAGLLLFA